MLYLSKPEPAATYASSQFPCSGAHFGSQGGAIFCLTRIKEVDPRALRMSNWQSGGYREDTYGAERDSLGINFWRTENADGRRVKYRQVRMDPEQMATGSLDSNTTIFTGVLSIFIQPYFTVDFSGGYLLFQSVALPQGMTSCCYDENPF